MLRNLLLAVLLCVSTVTLNYAQITCTGNLTVQIQGSGSNAALSVNPQITQPPCNSASTAAVEGAVDLTVTGGTTPYTFQWEVGGVAYSTAEDISGLGTGTYDVTITDGVGCMMEASYEILEPSQILVPGSFTSLDCNSSSGAADGTITITPSGGTVAGDYTYNWASSTGGIGLNVSAQNQVGLSAGTYQVTVTDDNNCTGTAEFTLDQPDPMNALASIEQPECNSGNSSAPTGSITINQIINSDGNHTFNWETTDGFGLNPTAQDQSGLSGGTYYVTITDGNNCSLEVDYTLIEPALIAVSGVPVNPGCNAASASGDGSIDITPTGEPGLTESDFTYEWSTVDGSGLDINAADQTGLSGGTYNVIVTYGNGCTVIGSWTLEEPAAIACSLSSPINSEGTNIDCFGDTGIITVAVQDGNPAFEFTLNGTDYTGAAVTIGPQASSEFEVLAGTYTITTLDGNGCSTSCDYTLTQPEEFVAGTCTTDDECQVNAGEIEVEAQGGVGPYTVTWSSPGAGTLDQNSQIIPTSGGSVIFTGAQGGATYIFTVTDASGCVIGG